MCVHTDVYLCIVYIHTNICTYVYKQMTLGAFNAAPAPLYVHRVRCNKICSCTVNKESAVNYGNHCKCFLYGS